METKFQSEIAELRPKEEELKVCTVYLFITVDYSWGGWSVIWHLVFFFGGGWGMQHFYFVKMLIAASKYLTHPPWQKIQWSLMKFGLYSKENRFADVFPSLYDCTCTKVKYLLLVWQIISRLLCFRKRLWNWPNVWTTSCGNQRWWRRKWLTWNLLLKWWIKS